MIFAGMFLNGFEQIVSAGLLKEYANTPDFDLAQYHRIAGMLPLTAIFVSCIALTGIGLGMLVSYRRGGSRVFLLALWMSGSRLVNDPMIHMLVWIAIYSILMAIQTPLIPMPAPSAPPGWHFELMLNSVLYGPAIAAVGFWLGVLLARRPDRVPSNSSSTPIPHPLS
jgi:hypothetical protein